MVGYTHQETQIFSSAKFDEHNNRFGKGCPPGSELMLVTNTSTIPNLKIDL